MTALAAPQPASAPLLDVRDLTVDFPTDDGLVRAVRGVSYTLGKGEVVGIVGESGSGKSVSCLALMGLLPRSARIGGSARLQGQDLVGMKPNHLNAYRGKTIAMVFQDPMTSLNPVHKVGAQVAEAIRAHNPVSKGEAWERAVQMLDTVGIPEPSKRADLYPHEFSGGMRQRAMIAMAMANDPEVLIADEPTTALDVTVQAQVLETLLAVKERTGVAVLLITHDLGVVAGMADRVLVMYAGKLVESGTVDSVYYSPRMPYTAGLLDSLPRLDTEGLRLTPIPGAPPSLINLPAGCPFSPRCPLADVTCLEVEPDLRPTDEDEHLAACHKWEDVAGETGDEPLFGGDGSDLTLPEGTVDEFEATHIPLITADPEGATLSGNEQGPIW